MKTIIFDFDGTLTKKDQNIWKMCWQGLGYPVDKSSLYAQLYVSHVIKKEITRKDWFDLTCESFQHKGMDRIKLLETSNQIELMDGFKETIKTLHDTGYSLHIVSGCITQSIYYVLGDYAKHFERIESNNAVFDDGGNLQELKYTNYDYEGKARYINEWKEKTGTKNEEITFIGNGDNDEWAYSSGCKTICINPKYTDSNNKTIWHSSIENLTDLREILPYILPAKTCEIESCK